MKRLTFLLIGLLLLSGCLEQKKDIFYIENLDTNSFDQNTIIEIAIWKSPGASLSMVDVGSDRNEFPGFAPSASNGSDRFVLDLNRVSQYRFISWIQNTTATTASLILQHSDTNIDADFYDSNIGNQERCCIDLNGGSGLKVGSWIDINQETANPRTYFRVMHVGGNGVNDTQFRSIAVQFKVPVATHATITGGGSGTDTNCSFNVNCVITGRINSGFDANVLDINIFGNGFIQTLTGDSLTIDHTSGSGSETHINLQTGGTGMCTIGRAFAAFAVFLCPSTGSAAGGLAFGTDLSNFILFAGAGLPSSITDPNGFIIAAPTTIQSTTDIDFSLNVDGNQTIHGSLGLTVDQNVNARDLNVSQNAHIRNLQVNQDFNVYRNARITKDLYVDQNIYADTYERDLGLGLNTCYTNSGRRDMHIYGNILVDVKIDNDAAYVDLQTGTGCGSLTTVQRTGISVFGANPNGVVENYYFPFSFLVHDGNAYQITSTTAGSGSVTLEANRGYFP